MKTNELRKGNIVSVHKGFEMVVHGTYGDDVVYLEVPNNPYAKEYDTIEEYYMKDVSGVPLTEEWLLKFGFKKPAHSWIGDIFHASEWDDYPLNWCVAFNKNNAILISKLKYVHQLQNLYFALTGQELEIK